MRYTLPSKGEKARSGQKPPRATTQEVRSPMPATKTRAKPPGTVAQARQDAGLTQAELAQRAGISRITVARIESSTMVPSVAIAMKIARALDTTVEALWGVE